MDSTCRLQPLAKATVAATRRLLDTVFPDQRWWERSSWALRLSLMPWFVSRPLLAFVGIHTCRYWIAVDSRENVLGVTGLYCRYGDWASLWLGWTCVEPHARGLGIGRRLIDFAMEEARRSGARSLKLYTTDLADQQIAVQAYERRGFKRYRTVDSRRRTTAFRYLYYRIDLGEREPRPDARPQ